MQSSEDEDVPEAFSLSQAKKSIKGRETALRDFQVGEKRKRKEKNKERDRKLKERAAASKETGFKRKRENEKEKEVLSVEDRMERAMREAEEEDEESEGESGAEDEEGDEGFGEDMSHDDEQSGSSSGSEEERDEGVDERADSDGNLLNEILSPPPDKLTSVSKAAYLPDHIFTSALSSKPAAKPAPATAIKHPSDSKDSNKRKRNQHKPKDLIVGSRTIRTLPSQSRQLSASTVPPRWVARFVDRSLGLHGGKPPGKTWERRSANIGVMRSSGPALNFVRNS